MFDVHDIQNTLLMIQLVMMKPHLRILTSIIVVRMEGTCILSLFIIIIITVAASQLNPHQVTKQLLQQRVVPFHHLITDTGTSLKKKRVRKDDIDELLVKSLNSLQEKKVKTVTNDEEGHFGQQVAATLRRYTPRQRALAKLRIQQVLTDVEFPPEFTSPGNHFSTSPMSYSSSIPTNYYNNHDSDSF